ncbi:unnamed protein product [Didymodactylos carnosus]|uniref:Uncharacterized protein n=1 Tax=Didymodactylos carnosus TaxID=1234261 RepID=A0A814ZPJ8_9BILA|nr:unnamed protein product [Didymodactylos carnosus]CAF4012055.1 unnamed protein product [Didymodactylos carnosus]
MIPTLLELLNDSKTTEIQLASCRLLSVVMTKEEIRNRLTNTAQITIILLVDFQNPVFNPFFKIRLDLAKNDQIKMELVKRNGLAFLNECITGKQQKLAFVTICQRALEIVFELIQNETALALLQQNHLLLYHIEKRLLSSSDYGVRQAARVFMNKLRTQKDSVCVKKKQDPNTKVLDPLRSISTNRILISYHPTNRDMCYRFRDYVRNDEFLGNLDLNPVGRSMATTADDTGGPQ